MGGLFYLGKSLMPSPTAINVEWMQPMIKVGMSKDEVRRTVGVEPTMSPSGIGRDETWYYTDTYNDQVHLAIQFIDGHVYKTVVEKPTP